MQQKVIRGQIVGGTGIDSQGESYDRQFLEDMVEGIKRDGGKIPLGQHHDMSKPYFGHLENFKVVSSTDTPDKYSIVADVYYSADAELPPDLRGFSWSTTVLHDTGRAAKDLDVYLPYPFYNDRALLDELEALDDGYRHGKWIKKSADPTLVSIVTAVAMLILQPMWQDAWNDFVKPRLLKLPKLLAKVQERKIYVDLCLPAALDEDSKPFYIYFCPIRGMEPICFDAVVLANAIQSVQDYLQNDPRAEVGVAMVKMVYDQSTSSYRFLTINYRDGSHHAFY